MSDNRWLNNLTWSFGSGEIKIIYRTSGFFSTCIHFPLCLREYQSREKCIRVNLTQSCKSGRSKLSLGFHEIFIWVDLIHGFRVEFMEKTWRVNNLIYGRMNINTFTQFQDIHPFLIVVYLKKEANSVDTENIGAKQLYILICVKVGLIKSGSWP